MPTASCFSTVPLAMSRSACLGQKSRPSGRSRGARLHGGEGSCPLILQQVCPAAADVIGHLVLSHPNSSTDAFLATPPDVTSSAGWTQPATRCRGFAWSASPRGTQHRAARKPATSCLSPPWGRLRPGDVVIANFGRCRSCRITCPRDWCMPRPPDWCPKSASDQRDAPGDWMRATPR